MDSITQAALGGVVGELVLGKKLGWRGMAWGMLFGTLPDLDVLFSPWLEVTERLRWHRGISHSILMMGLASLVFAKPLARLHRGRGLSVKRAGYFVFLAWSTHVLIDVFTSYGTQIYEPFSDHRVSTGNLFIIDLFFTLPLLLCVFYRLWMGLVSLKCWVLWRRGGAESEGDELPKYPDCSRRFAGSMVLLSSLYVVFSFVMKLWAVDQIGRHMEEEIPNGSLVMVAPSPLNTILWRGLVETEAGYFVTYWSPFDDGAAKFDFLAKGREAAKLFEGEKSFETLKWFAKGHWVARASPGGKVIFINMRFGEFRNQETKRLVPMFQWLLEYDDDGKMRATSYRPRDLDFKRALAFIWERLKGEREGWEEMDWGEERNSFGQFRTAL